MERFHEYNKSTSSFVFIIMLAFMLFFGFQMGGRMAGHDYFNMDDKNMVDILLTLGLFLVAYSQYNLADTMKIIEMEKSSPYIFTFLGGLTENILYVENSGGGPAYSLEATISSQDNMLEVKWHVIYPREKREINIPKEWKLARFLKEDKLKILISVQYSDTPTYPPHKTWTNEYPLNPIPDIRV